MNEINDGGSAFPRAGHEWEEMSWVPAPAEKGMTLRDYFAAQAMQGFIAYATHKGIYAPPDEELAKVSYQLADAMLKAREKNHE